MVTWCYLCGALGAGWIGGLLGCGWGLGGLWVCGWWAHGLWVGLGWLCWMGFGADSVGGLALGCRFLVRFLSLLVWWRDGSPWNLFSILLCWMDLTLGYALPVVFYCRKEEWRQNDGMLSFFVVPRARWLTCVAFQCQCKISIAEVGHRLECRWWHSAHGFCMVAVGKVNFWSWHLP